MIIKMNLEAIQSHGRQRRITKATSFCLFIQASPFSPTGTSESMVIIMKYKNRHFLAMFLKRWWYKDLKKMFLVSDVQVHKYSFGKVDFSTDFSTDLSTDFSNDLRISSLHKLQIPWWIWIFLHLAKKNWEQETRSHGWIGFSVKLTFWIQNLAQKSISLVSPTLFKSA